MARITKRNRESIQFLEQRMRLAQNYADQCAARVSNNISPSRMDFTNAFEAYTEAAGYAFALLVLYEGFELREQIEAHRRYDEVLVECKRAAHYWKREIESRLPASRAVSW